GPDGALYYISRGAGAGGAPGIGTGTVRRIAYGADAPPSIVVNPASQLATGGASVEFSVSAAGTSPFSYQWQESTGGGFVDIPGAVSPTLVLQDVQLGDSGKSYRAVVTNTLGSATSAAATLSVTSDTPPTAQILSPSVGSTYSAGDTISISGVGFDAEDGPLNDSQLTWRVDFHHNVHSHPFIPPTSGVNNFSFVVPTLTETDSDVWYRVNLTATDSAGLTSTTFVDVFPETSDFVVETNLPDSGGLLTIDGHVVEGPFVATGVVNVQRTLSAPQVQHFSGQTAYFYQWLDGETSPTRTISTPEDNTAYVALYRTFDDDFVYLSDLIPSETPINGWGPIELDASNGEQQLGDGGPITLNGVTYAKGLGVHSYSEVTYDLSGQYTRFVSDIGIDDEANGTVVFRVLGDGVELYNSGTMAGTTPTKTVDVEVLGVNELKLIVEENGDGNGMDHADWADAKLALIASDPLVDINFQLAVAPTPGGYLADSGQQYGDRGNGWSYGWSSDHTDVSRDRDINPDQLLDTLLHFHANADWEIEVPNGEYLVTVSIGDAGFVSDHTLNVEGQNYWAAEHLEANQFATQTQRVTVSDGRLTLDSGAAGDKATRINYLRIATPLNSGQVLPFTASDLDQTGRLDLQDVVAFGAGWGVDGSQASLEQRARQGDLDFDGDTDQDDWDILNQRWLQENNAPLSFQAVINPIAGDYNRNGVVTSADYLVWRAGYGALGAHAADGADDGRVDSADYTVWRDHLGSGIPGGVQLDALVLVIDPQTGEGTLLNDSPAAIDLVGYSVLSQAPSLLFADGGWLSLEDQQYAGWEEAAPTDSALSELTNASPLTLQPGERLPLGGLFDLSAAQSGLSLEFARDGAAAGETGYVVFSELDPFAPELPQSLAQLPLSDAFEGAPATNEETFAQSAAASSAFAARLAPNHHASARAVALAEFSPAPSRRLRPVDRRVDLAEESPYRETRLLARERDDEDRHEPTDEALGQLYSLDSEHPLLARLLNLDWLSE
ncbi:MAG: NPCBM/NEW2 domain-containing protein, partial [Planctomycetales bacterium]|nr:NPCBM/NEW2 domain-containing protein [Planctomycetales bacterium]